MVESVVATGAGLITSMVVQAIIYPMFGFDVTFKQNILITFIFTLVSLIRGYLIRRLFCKYKI